MSRIQHSCNFNKPYKFKLFMWILKYVQAPLKNLYTSYSSFKISESHQIQCIGSDLVRLTFSSLYYRSKFAFSNFFYQNKIYFLYYLVISLQSVSMSTSSSWFIILFSISQKQAVKLSFSVSQRGQSVLIQGVFHCFALVQTS